jgi:glycosyltransferase involved in cell wall biosynthesis
MTAPSVSIIIPCFNTGHYLGEAIESALAQTMPDFEIIVVDDGSTDSTREVALGFDDPRLHYVYQENAGLCAARNAGTRASHGRLLAFLDADDTLMPDKLAVQMDFLARNPQYGLVAAHFVRVGPDATAMTSRPRPALPGGPIALEDVLVACPIATHSMLVSRTWFDRAGGYSEELSGAGDWDFYCRLAIAGCKFYKLPRDICFYRHTPTSMSLLGRQQTDEMLQVVARTFANPALPDTLRHLEARARTETVLKGMARCYAARDFEIARDYLREALTRTRDAGRVDAEDVADRFKRLVSHYAIEDPAAWYQEILDHLPEDAPEIDAIRQAIRTLMLETRIRTSLREREFKTLLSTCWKLLGHAPLRLASWILLSPQRRLSARRT